MAVGDRKRVRGVRRAEARRTDRIAPPRSGGATSDVLGRICRVLAREPLVHFLVLAALLFGAYHLLSPAARESIVIDQASVDDLVRQQEELLARPLSDEERRGVLDGAIDDEVLLREAYRRGLDRDAVVRQHLVQKMRFILGEDQPEPTEAELRAYLEANRERYRTPPTVTLDHVFYADPAAVPADLMAQLENGADIDGLGDPLDMLGSRLPAYSLRDLIGLMGPDVARRVFELEPGGWHGPMQSARGVHFVRIAEHHPPAMPSFAELESYLRQDWTLDQQRRAIADKLAALRQNYRIVVRQETP
jgi:PPIC-type PPIASE domain